MKNIDDNIFLKSMPGNGKRIMSDVVVVRRERTAPPPEPIYAEPAPTSSAPLPSASLRSAPGEQKKWSMPRMTIPRFNFRWHFPVFPRGKTIFFVVAGLFVWMVGSMVFARMRVTVFPKTASVSLDENVFLSKNPVKSSELLFGTITLPDKREGAFPAKEKKEVQQYARGTVTIFNTSAKTPQVLIASTRLADPSGKIYRIPKTIIVPGYTVVAGKTVPGSREVEVVADKPGDEYNITLSDFTIPGFSGSPKFTKIFARSKTEITGGARGTKSVISKREVDAVRAGFIDRAKSEAYQTLLKKLPPDSFLLKSSVEYAVTHEAAVPQPGEVGDSFTMRIEGEARGVILNKKAFEKLLAAKIPSYEENFVFAVKNLDQLSYELSGYSFGANAFRVRVKGIAQFESVIDTELVRRGVLGRGVANSATLLNVFPEVARSEISFRPFWLRRIPNNPSRIDVSIK